MATVVAQILDVSIANHMNICCFLHRNCCSSLFDPNQFDPVWLYADHCNWFSTPQCLLTSGTAEANWRLPPKGDPVSHLHWCEQKPSALFGSNPVMNYDLVLHLSCNHICLHRMSRSSSACAIDWFYQLLSYNIFKNSVVWN